MTFKCETEINSIDANEIAQYEEAISSLSLTTAEAAKLRALAAAMWGEDYVRNIERMSIENAAEETYTREGHLAARQPAPFLVDMLFALDPSGGMGMRGVKIG